MHLGLTIQQFARGLGVAVAVVALRLGNAFFAGTAAYRFAFLLIAIMVVVSFLEAIALPHAGGDVLRSRSARVPLDPGMAV